MKNVLYNYIKYAFIIFVFCIMFFPLRINSAENCPAYQELSEPVFDPVFSLRGGIIDVYDYTFGEITGSDLTGGYYLVNTEECTDCELRDHREVIAPEVIRLEYKFDDENWDDATPVDYGVNWFITSGGFTGCMEGTEVTFYDKTRYKFDFSITLLPEFLDGSRHTLHVRSVTRYNHPAGTTFEAYTVSDTAEASFEFGGTYCEMSASPNPTGGAGNKTTLSWTSYNTIGTEEGCNPSWRPDNPDDLYNYPFNSSQLSLERKWELDVYPSTNTTYSVSCNNGGIHYSCSIPVAIDLPCDCSDVSGGIAGWYDPPEWGGCDDCGSNQTVNRCDCEPALAYCNGCYWDYGWDPFRDETYAGTGPGHKCPGNPCIGGNNLPIGSHDGFPLPINPNTEPEYSTIEQPQERCVAGGWAADPDNTSTDLNVRVVSDGLGVATASANIPRGDLGLMCSGTTCAYNINIFDYITHNVNHTITTQAQDADTGEWVNLPNTPKTINCTETLSCNLTSNKPGGKHPLTGLVLTADVSGTAVGTINYTFYCDRADTGTNITTPYGYKIDGTNEDPKSAPGNTCEDVYDEPGTYIAKAIVERGTMQAQCQKTITVTNDPPIAKNLKAESSDQCRESPYYTFSWTYDDPDDDNQSQFKFQVDNNNDFTSPTVDKTVNVDYENPAFNSQTVNLSTTVDSSGSDYLAFGSTRYYWRVKVTDAYGASSAWTYPSPASLITPAHHYPKVSFTNLPRRPNINEDVQFTDASTCYDDVAGGSPCTKPNDSFDWTFEDGNPDESNDENPVVVFTSLGNKTIEFEVEDSDGYSCTYKNYYNVNKTLNINYPPPTWKEVLPIK